MPKIKFSELVQINPTVRLEKEEAYPFIPMEAITPGKRYVEATGTRVAGGGAKFCGGDTLFARITPCLENGKIAQYKAPRTVKAFGSTEYWILRAREGVSDPAYVYYLSTSDIIRKPAEKSMSGASGRQRADVASIEDLEVESRTLAEQVGIATILSSYDDLIENNNRRIGILEEILRLTYEEWFVHYRFPEYEQVTILESEQGRIPEGWKWKQLRDLAFDVRAGVSPDQIDPSTPYVGLEHIPRRSIALCDWGSAGEVHSTKLRFSAGDILFGKIRPYFHKVAVAPVDGVASSDAIIIRAKDSTNYSLVLAAVSSDAFVAEATQSSNGTKMPRANWDVLLGYKIPCPPEPLIARFNEVIDPMISFIRTAVLKNRNLRATRDILLPKLLSGEINLSDTPEAREAVPA